MPNFRGSSTLTDQAVADGHGGNSYAAMIEQFRKLSGERR
jgi:hypothetical protein